MLMSKWLCGFDRRIASVCLGKARRRKELLNSHLSRYTELLETRRLLSSAPVALNDTFSTNENQPLVSPQRVTSLQMTSDPGDYIGAGLTYNYLSNNTNITSNGWSSDHVYFSVTSGSDWWYLNFSTGNYAVPLTVGTYQGAARYPFNSGTPGLDISGNGRGSNMLTGSFTVTEISFSSSGVLQSFAASFEQHSEGASPALRGTIEYNSLAAVNVLANDFGTAGNSLSAVLVSPASHGRVSLNSDGSFGYTPNPKYHGIDSFTYKAQDGSSSSNVATASIIINEVDHPPLGTSTTVSTIINKPYVFKRSDFGFSDPNDFPANSLQAVEITTLPLAGSLTDNGQAVTAGQFVSEVDIASGQLKFTPANNASGAGYASWKFQVQDDGGTANGGIDTDLTPRLMTINVNATHTAPIAVSDSYSLLENQPLNSPQVVTRLQMVSDPGDWIGQGATYDFSPANGTFSLSSGSPGFAEISFTNLTDNWTIDLKAPDPTKPFTVGTYLGATRYPFNALKTPGLNVDGDGRGSNTLTGSFTINAVSYSPAGVLTGISASFEQHSEGGTPALRGTVQYNNTIGTSVIANDIDPDGYPLTANVVTEPAHGYLAFNSDGSFKYTPDTNVYGTDSFTYTVYDGFRKSNIATVTFNVGQVDNPPIGTSHTVTSLENKSYTLKTSDFGFTDPNDIPSNRLLAVKISTLAAVGTLTDNGVAVTAGQYVNASDISGQKLVFTPAMYGAGNSYASFTFQVEDDGVTLNGGTNLDPNPKMMTINVTPVTQAPAGNSGSVTTLENTDYKFATADFGFTDPHNLPPNTLSAVKITTLANAGTLIDNGVKVSAGQLIPVADITAGKFIFRPATYAKGAGYSTFKFQVQDNGSTANGGINLDPSPKTLTINVTAVTQPPLGKANTVTTAKNAAYTFKVADFGFSDPHNSPPNTFTAVKITTLTSLGSLTNNGIAVKAGAFISVADVSAGKLKFTPAKNGTGIAYASFQFQVQDNGDTANGGMNTDPTSRKLTISVSRKS